jgi:amino-acid N-acetyltransferase
MQFSIERAVPGDAPAILQLLAESRLPVEGLLPHLNTALVARVQGRVIGSATLEVYPDGALLRSVAVAPVARGFGVGHQLTESALELARTLDVSAVFLLTTTAEDFFPRFAFSRITREDVPAAVQESIEFQSACPSSATVMRTILAPKRNPETSE